MQASRTVMARPPWLWLTLALTLASGSALAQQPVRPLPKVGGCPLGYYSSRSYCVPSTSDNTHGAIEKIGNSCPLGFYASGNYCLSSPSNDHEAIQKMGKSCPLGWFSSGSYCINRPWSPWASARLGPLPLNFVKGGLSSISVGGHRASFNILVSHSGGPRTTVGLPVTGMRWSVHRTPSAGLPNSRRLRPGQLDALKQSLLDVLRQ